MKPQLCKRVRRLELISEISFHSPPVVILRSLGFDPHASDVEWNDSDGWEEALDAVSLAVRLMTNLTRLS